MDSLYLRLDAANVVIGSTRSPDPQPDAIVAAQNLVAVDQPTYDAGRAATGACQYVGNALQPYAPPAAPAPPRVAPLSGLLDPLSAAQRAAITADHMGRLQAEVFDHLGGLPIGNAKVARAAADLGLTPDAWFKLAGF